ncbi:1-acyl-sn-glycerol-3-phosphate acyltransferase [Chitinophagaceae bacterium LB-8]|uniref:1-acyl-sn-glycerol-3-phosphate acyltransferase n=1 Tax=Paraflavisolibacter caeni TaxID=2982496 RepID=A0A9X2XPG9_9BACT|nr:lysophospholipid acyltransferase family protein [Paraflavisolibacter caeni]MCU7550859.1 1-acyl-sn-glycerol-3-phosphate acyltransferase [Paraflavisolibacter caeni]
MNLLKNILGRIFALWTILYFSVSLLVIIIPIWLISFQPEPKRTIYSFKIFNVWLATFFFFTGVKRRIKGKENFKKGENYIVICNHNNFMDVPLSSPAIPGPNKTIAKIEMAKIPFFGVIYKAGSVLVDRKNEQSRKKSYAKMKQVLSMGLHMCIYPEGTRNKTSQPLARFQDGAFRLSVDTGKSIIPAVIFNTSKVFPNNKKFFFWPQPVEMHFLAPISPENKTAEQLKQEAFEIMKDYYVQHKD